MYLMHFKLLHTKYMSNLLNIVHLIITFISRKDIFTAKINNISKILEKLFCVIVLAQKSFCSYICIYMHKCIV